MSCDDCRYYDWYRDFCKRWKIKMDYRAMHDCFTPKPTPEVVKDGKQS